MRKIIRLFRCDYLGLCRRQPVRHCTLKTLVGLPSNVEVFPVFSSFKRQFSQFNGVKSTFGIPGAVRFSDNASERVTDNVVIYNGALTSQIKGVKIFTCISSLGGLVVQPLLLQNIMAGESVPLCVAAGTVVGFFTFVTPFLIHLLTKKYVTEIKYNEKTDTYIATTLSFFLRRINVDFKLEDIAIPTKLPMFTTVTIKGRPVFIVGDSFLEVSHYIKLMGYDKPMDFNLSMPIDKGEEQQLEKGKKSVAS